jgi:hypothetical protein
MYGKLFPQMYDGTLGTKGPWQALITFQQFVILCDQHGILDMTASAIARRTTIPLEIITQGIAALLLPDPESRTPTEDGRRLVPLSEDRSWGWRVVNYEHYRQLKREEDRRGYHAQYYRTKRSVSAKSGIFETQPELNTTQHTQQIQPIAEAEAEAVNTITQPAGFDEFYKVYPRKVGRAAAAKAFKAVKASAILSNLLADIERRLTDGEWSATAEKIKFIPHPATYLSGRRWEDEPVGPAAATSAWEGAL